jgi:acyl carrier protein
MPHDMTTLSGSPALPLLSAALAKRLRKDGRGSTKLDPDTDLIEYGLIDSQALLDMILEAEEGSGLQFDAEGMDFESGVTLRRLAAAFAPA